MKNIDQILAKYWEGETSLEEEKILKDYFQSGNIADEHKKYNDLFVFFGQESEVKYTKTNVRKKAVHRPLRMRLPGVAAAVLIFLMAGIWMYNQYQKEFNKQELNWSAYEVEDPEKAREVVVDALAFLSEKLNKGEQNMRSNLKVLEKMPVK